MRRWSVTNASSWARTWDGRNAAGKRVADGRYQLRVSLADAAGNERTVSSRPWSWIGPAASCAGRAASSRRTRTRSPPPRPSPGGSRATRRRRCGCTTPRGRWSGPSGRARHSTRATARWTWNGRLAGGSFAPQGRYEARLTVASTLGTVVLSRARVGERLRRDTVRDAGEARTDAQGRVHDGRAAGLQADGRVQAAGPGRGDRDRDEAIRRFVHGLVQGAAAAAPGPAPSGSPRRTPAAGSTGRRSRSGWCREPRGSTRPPCRPVHSRRMTTDPR